MQAGNPESRVPSAAEAYYRQRHCLAHLKTRIADLCAAVGRPTDLLPFQWAQVMAMVLDFQPDLILELGRGYGNSTCAFAEAAYHLSPDCPCNILSICQANSWRTCTLPRIQALNPPEWFQSISALETEICTFDFDPPLGAAQRVLVFWDAHGFEVAATVLSKIMPALAAKPHLVLMHDLCDARYLPEEARSYGEMPLWTGNNWDGPRVRLGNVESTVEQAIAAIDFTSRNCVPLLSAEHSFHSELSCEQREEMQAVLGDLFSLKGFWFYFTLNGGRAPFTFPRPPVISPPQPPVPPPPPPPPAEEVIHTGFLSRTTARWRRSIRKRYPRKPSPVPPPALL